MEAQRGVKLGRVLPSGVLIWAVLLAGNFTARAQGPAEVEEPPGTSVKSRRLGPDIGAAGMPGLGEIPGESSRPLGLRPGPSVSRAPVGGLAIPTTTQLETPPRFRPREIEAAQVPQYGELTEPAAPESPGPPGGLTLDGAIDMLMLQNLALVALRYEIPMSRADVLTAGLRANPILYADTQLVPYGHYSYENTGGPLQYDLNVTIPLDVTRKRLARRAVAERARGRPSAVPGFHPASGRQPLHGFRGCDRRAGDPAVQPSLPPGN